MHIRFIFYYLKHGNMCFIEMFGRGYKSIHFRDGVVTRNMRRAIAHYTIKSSSISSVKGVPGKHLVQKNDGSISVFTSKNNSKYNEAFIKSPDGKGFVVHSEDDLVKGGEIGASKIENLDLYLKANSSVVKTFVGYSTDKHLSLGGRIMHGKSSTKPREELVEGAKSRIKIFDFKDDNTTFMKLNSSEEFCNRVFKHCHDSTSDDAKRIIEKNYSKVVESIKFMKSHEAISPSAVALEAILKSYGYDF